MSDRKTDHATKRGPGRKHSQGKTHLGGKPMPRRITGNLK